MMNFSLRQFQYVALWLVLAVNRSLNASLEPYVYLHGGYYLSNTSDGYVDGSLSPDPLVNYRWNFTANSNLSNELQIYNVTAKSASIMKGKESSFAGLDSVNGESTHVNMKINGTGMILIDFGQENAGWFEFDSDNFNNNSKSVYLSLSEYNIPWWIYYGQFNKTKIPLALSNNKTFQLKTNDQYYEGTRFGFIIVENSIDFTINQLRCVSQIRPNNYVGSFISPLITFKNNEKEEKENVELSKIWYTAAYCVKMNVMPIKVYDNGTVTGGMGAILMYRGDRIAWVGDNHISQKVLMYAFGDFDYVFSQLYKTRNDDNNGLLSYALYWVQSVYDYFLFTNDTDSLVSSFVVSIDRILNNAISNFPNQFNSLTFYGWDDRIGAGFQQPDSTPEAQYAYKMLTIDTLLKTSEMYLKLGKDYYDLATKYNTTAHTFIQIIKNDSNWLNKFGLHSSADAINGGWLTNDEISYLFSQHYNDSLQICSFSSFNQFFIVTSMSHATMIDNITDYIISSIDLCWGGQIKLNGATSFYETFSPIWPAFAPNEPVPNSNNGFTSQCHPWASGVLSFMSKSLLGVHIIEPGFGKIEIAPMLSVIKGSIPVAINVKDIPKGEYDTSKIKIEFDANNGKYSVFLPKTMKMDLYLPLSDDYSGLDRGGISSVKHIWNDNNDAETIENFEIVQRLKNKFYIYIESNERNEYNGGTHEFIIDFGNGIGKNEKNEKNENNKKIILENPFPPISYQCEFLGFDNKTQGDWIGKYGKDGYILFGYNAYANGTILDLNKLPSYVVNQYVGISSPLHGQYTGNTSDVRALQDPVNTNNRKLGYYNGVMSMSFDFALDLSSVQGNSVNISLYSNDWNDVGAAQWIRIMDLTTFDLIAPTVYVANIGQCGKWITFEVDRSVRVRIDQVPTLSMALQTSTLSAIMFN